SRMGSRSLKDNGTLKMERNSNDCERLRCGYVERSLSRHILSSNWRKKPCSTPSNPAIIGFMQTLSQKPLASSLSSALTRLGVGRVFGAKELLKRLAHDFLHFVAGRVGRVFGAKELLKLFRYTCLHICCIELEECLEQIGR